MTVREPPTDYAVGYRKPPKEHQFKKGHRANPKGRPKAKAQPASIDDALNKTVTITEGGKARKVPVLEAVALQMVSRALAGDARAQRDTLRLASQREEQHHRRALAEPPPEPPPTPGLLPFRIMTYAQAAMEKLGVSIDRDGEMVMRTWVVEAALARLSPDELADIDLEVLANDVEDPAVLAKYTP